MCDGDSEGSALHLVSFGNSSLGNSTRLELDSEAKSVCVSVDSGAGRLERHGMSIFQGYSRPWGNAWRRKRTWLAEVGRWNGVCKQASNNPKPPLSPQRVAHFHVRLPTY